MPTGSEGIVIGIYSLAKRKICLKLVVVVPAIATDQLEGRRIEF
jgi:hypothetical protein